MRPRPSLTVWWCISVFKWDAQIVLALLQFWSFILDESDFLFNYQHLLHPIYFLWKARRRVHRLCEGPGTTNEGVQRWGRNSVKVDTVLWYWTFLYVFFASVVELKGLHENFVEGCWSLDGVEVSDTRFIRCWSTLQLREPRLQWWIQDFSKFEL